MLAQIFSPPPSDADQRIFEKVVPQDHLLRKVAEVVPWDDFLGVLATYYSVDEGRPPILPVTMLKLEYLRYQYRLSDREVIARAQTDLAFRWFLQLPLAWKPPHPTSLCVFRGRLGTEGFRKIFDQVVAAARAHGVVQDRLRLKDATHVIANMAAPTALALVAQIRDKLLAAAEPFAAEMVEGERVNLELVRAASRSLKDEERLATRLGQLREMLYWADELPPPEDAENNRLWQTFLTQRDLAHKIFDDQQHPNAKDRTRSTTDPDARRGKHGDWYEGFQLDILLDPDSGIITQINVLPANGDEAADAIALVLQEEAAHGNDIQALSIDGAGFNGPLLHELQDPDGLNIDTYVPPPKTPDTGVFTPPDFVEDPERGVVTCPAGQTSKHRERDEKRHTTVYRFAEEVCLACPLMKQCLKKAPENKQGYGRTVRKSDFQAEHEGARKKTTTPEYIAVRREHPQVERKLSEVMNLHGGRYARYRGIGKVLIQELMACTATNVRRLTRLVCAPQATLCPQE